MSITAIDGGFGTDSTPFTRDTVCTWAISAADPSVLNFEIYTYEGDSFVSGYGGSFFSPALNVALPSKHIQFFFADSPLTVALGAFGIYDGPEPGRYRMLSGTGNKLACSGPGCRVYSTSASFSVYLIVTNRISAPSFSIYFRGIPAFKLAGGVVSTSTTETDPAVAVNGPVVLVLFSSNVASVGSTSIADFDILVTRSTDAGVTWGRPYKIDDPAASSDSANDFNPSIAWNPDNNMVVAIWQSELSGIVSIKVAVSTNAVSETTATTWTVLTLATAPNGASFASPTIVSNGVAWVAAWTANNLYGRDSDIVFSRCRAPSNLGDWTSPKAVSPLALLDLGMDVTPSLSVASNFFVLSWSSSDNHMGMLGSVSRLCFLEIGTLIMKCFPRSDWDILSVESADDGRTWSFPLSPYSEAGNPNVIANSINVSRSFLESFYCLTPDWYLSDCWPLTGQKTRADCFLLLGFRHYCTFLELNLARPTVSGRMCPCLSNFLC